MNPSVPYAWQPIGEYLEIIPSGSKRLNVLGFFSIDNQLEPYCFQGKIDSQVVVACFDDFSKKITTKTVVVLDNAPVHTSEEFEENIKRWRKRGLFLKFIPPYSPELNLIEILWRFIKHQWLPLSAYSSFATLVGHVENILKKVGTTYTIEFSNA